MRVFKTEPNALFSELTLRGSFWMFPNPAGQFLDDPNPAGQFLDVPNPAGQFFDVSSFKTLISRKRSVSVKILL